MPKLKEILEKLVNQAGHPNTSNIECIDQALSAIKKELEACVPEKRYIHPLANTASTEVQKGLAENKIITQTLMRIKEL